MLSERLTESIWVNKAEIVSLVLVANFTDLALDQRREVPPKIRTMEITKIIASFLFMVLGPCSIFFNVTLGVSACQNDVLSDITSEWPTFSPATFIASRK